MIQNTEYGILKADVRSKELDVGWLGEGAL
jgi:hypothetical protein